MLQNNIMELKPFRKIGLTAYELKIIRALQHQNDLKVKEIVKLSGVPESRVYNILNVLIEKKLVEKRLITSNNHKKLTEIQKKKILEAIERSVELGIHIKFNGFRQASKVFHLTDNLEKYLDGYIKKSIADMNKLKNILIGRSQ
jgi:DNA-binding MarR family transcriptional regulator